MRLSFLMVAAAIALLASGTVVSAMANDESISSPDQVFSGETEGRQLRVHKTTSDDHEERGFNAEKFNRLMNEKSYRSRRFGNWVDKKYTDTDIYNKLRVDSNPSYSRIFHYYQNYLERFAPRLISP